MLDHPEIGSICSGGRYDNLAGVLHRQAAARRRHLHRPDAAVLRPGRAGLCSTRRCRHRPGGRADPAHDRGHGPAIALATATARQQGIRTQLYARRRNSRPRCSYADKLGIPYAVFLGEDEIAAGTGRRQGPGAPAQQDGADRRAGRRGHPPRSGRDGTSSREAGIRRAINPLSILLNKKEETMTCFSPVPTPAASCAWQHAGQTGEACPAGWRTSARSARSLAFVVVRDFYGTTQVVIETEEMVQIVKAINTRIHHRGRRAPSASAPARTPSCPPARSRSCPSKIEVLGRCRHNELPFEINRSREADETTRLKYRYLDLRNPAVKSNIVLRCNVVAALRQRHDRARLPGDHHARS